MIKKLALCIVLSSLSGASIAVNDSEPSQVDRNERSTNPSAALRPMTDEEVRKLLVDGEISSFSGLCPCPFSKDDHGKDCGDNSQYIRATGTIHCYPADVTDPEVYNYRAKHNLPDPNQPWQVFPKPTE